MYKHSINNVIIRTFTRSKSYSFTQKFERFVTGILTQIFIKLGTHIESGFDSHLILTKGIVYRSVLYPFSASIMNWTNMELQALLKGKRRKLSFEEMAKLTAECESENQREEAKQLLKRMTNEKRLDS